MTGPAGNAWEYLSPLEQFPVLRYFSYAHLPPQVQDTSKAFSDLAFRLVQNMDGGTNAAEVTAGLRKLLEAKDCFVRANL